MKPVTRLTWLQMQEVKQAIWKRDDLRAHIREQLSNEALAARFGVNVCTIERAIRYNTADCDIHE